MVHKRIRRIAISSMLTLCLVGVLPFAVQAKGSEFKDITESFWGYSSIVWAKEVGIVYGYPDGTFKPDQSVSQSEFLAMLIRAYLKSDLLPSGDSNDWGWGAPYIKYGFNMGWGSSIVSPPSSKLNTMPGYNIFETRNYVAKLIANASGRNYSFDDSIRFLLDSGLAEGKTDKSIDGFKGHDFLTRAEAVTFIKNLKTKLDMLYPSPTLEHSYDPATLNLSPFESFPLEVDKPLNNPTVRYSNIALGEPTAGYSLVQEPSFTIKGTVTEAVGNDLTIEVEYWDSGFFKPVKSIKATMKNGDFSARIDLQKLGVYRMVVTSEFERDSKKMDQNITLTSFYVEYKAKG